MKKNAWPRVLLAVILLFIACVIAFFVFSLRHRVDLVAPDYYDQTIRYQEHIDGSRRAMGLAGGPVLRVEGRALSLVVPNHHSATGAIVFYRPSDAALDRQLPLALDGEGRQSMDLSELAAGPWRIRVTWVVSNTTFIVEALKVL